MIERALATDLDAVLALMREYYSFDGLKFDQQKAAAAMNGLLSGQEFGAVWVLRDGSRIVGYMALCLGYSLEFGGRDAFIDELFIAEPFRNQGWGRKLIETAIEAAHDAGVRALHLTVERTNPVALQLYRKLAFEPRRASLLTRVL